MIKVIRIVKGAQGNQFSKVTKALLTTAFDAREALLTDLPQSARVTFYTRRGGNEKQEKLVEPRKSGRLTQLAVRYAR